LEIWRGSAEPPRPRATGVAPRLIPVTKYQPAAALRPLEPGLHKGSQAGLWLGRVSQHGGQGAVGDARGNRRLVRTNEARLGDPHQGRVGAPGGDQGRDELLARVEVQGRLDAS